nr:FecR domain-containing protein [Sphingomonas pseudosanguinis]
MLAQRPDPYSVETAAGERRVVALGDGTRIEMSGGTRLTLDHHDDRVAALDRGQALFTVRHDAAHPFTLTAGGVAVRDLGTVFDVARDGPRLAVQVASGSVMVQPDRDRITLTPGQTLLTDEASGHAVRGTVAPADVGGWRQGRIALTGATLGDLASAWRRLYGTRLNLTGALAQRPFTGMVALTGKAERDVPHVAALIGADWRRNGEDWIIEAPGGSSR